MNDGVTDWELEESAPLLCGFRYFPYAPLFTPYYCAITRSRKYLRSQSKTPTPLPQYTRYPLRSLPCVAPQLSILSNHRNVDSDNYVLN